MFPICCFVDHSRFSLQSFCLLAACSSCEHELPAIYPSPPLISAIVLYTITVEPTCCIWLGAGNLTIGSCAGGSLRPIRSSRYARVHGPLRTTETRTAPPLASSILSTNQRDLGEPFKPVWSQGIPTDLSIALLAPNGVSEKGSLHGFHPTLVGPHRNFGG